MADLDRDELLAALSRLDDSDDASAAEAARAASTLLSEAGLAWSDIIVPAATIAALAEPPAAASETATPANAATNTDDALVLIDKLLARDSLYEGTRDDLLAYKEDIAEGTFDDSDLAYLNALYARVMSNSVGSDD